MCVTAVDREEGVREGSARPVERVPVAVFARFEPDVDVDLEPVSEMTFETSYIIAHAWSSQSWLTISPLSGVSWSNFKELFKFVIWEVDFLPDVMNILALEMKISYWRDFGSAISNWYLNRRRAVIAKVKSVVETNLYRQLV